jgi:hypothetical protein
MHTGSYVLPIPMLKGRNNVQIQSKFKILMTFLYQNLTFFRMVHLVFQETESYMLKIQVECKISFRVLSILLYIMLALHQKKLHHWKEHEILVYKQHRHFAFSIYSYFCSYRAWEYIRTDMHICMHAAHTSKP